MKNVLGTRYYLFTNDKSVKDKYFDDTAKLTDEPEFGYQLQIAKTIGEWLPLFHATKHIRSVKDIKALYDTGLFKIYDENGTELNWEKFSKEVLEYNGGTIDKRTLKKVKRNTLYDGGSLPEHTPVSHFESKAITCYPSTLSHYFYDEENYEFCDEQYI